MFSHRFNSFKNFLLALSFNYKQMSDPQVISIVISFFKNALASKYASLRTVCPVLGCGDTLSTLTKWAVHTVCCLKSRSWSLPRSKPSSPLLVAQGEELGHISVGQSAQCFIWVSLWSTSCFKNLPPMERGKPGPCWKKLSKCPSTLPSPDISGILVLNCFASHWSFEYLSLGPHCHLGRKTSKDFQWAACPVL